MNISNYEQELIQLTEREKVNYIINLSDESLRLSLLKHVESDLYKIDIIKSLHSEELKLEGIKQLKSDFYINNVCNTLTKVNIIEEALKYVESDLIKIDIIKRLENENDRLNLSKHIESEGYRIRVLKTITDEELKVKAVSMLNSDSCKVEIICALRDENIRYGLLNQINDDNIKEKVIETFGDTLKCKSIEKLELDFIKENIIIKITDESLRLSLLKHVESDSYKMAIIKSLHSEELKLEGIKQLKSDFYIKNVCNTLTKVNIIEEALKYVESDLIKIDIIKRLENENDRLNLSKHIESEGYRIRVLKTITDEELKVKAVSMLNSDSCKVEIINTINDDKLKIIALLLLSDIDENIIMEIKDISLKELLVKGTNNEVNFHILLSKLVSDFINNNEISNYKDIMECYFQNGSFNVLYHFDINILQEVYDDKQNKILNEYRKINNEKMRKVYTSYIIKNYENINMDNLDKVSQILFQINMSNSSELQSFGDIIANQVLNHDNSLQYFSQVENIFVKNNMPYVGKIFEVFKLLHSNPEDYRNYSPLLNRFKNSNHQIQMMDLVIFNDLLKCAFGSNNRSLKNLIDDIDKGNSILTNVMTDKTLLNHINNEEKNILIKYIDRIETILDSYGKWTNKKTYVKTSEELMSRVNYIIDRLNLKGNDYKDIPDIIIKKLCGISGIDTFENAKHYFDYIILETDRKNREKAKEPFILEEGDFVKGINDVKYLSRILQNGSVAKEFLGDAADSDFTPLDTDLSRIVSKNMDGKQSNEIGKIIDSTISSSFGNTWFVLKNDPNRIEITRDSNNIEKNRNLSPKFSKLEAFKTLNDNHYGIRTGFPSCEISYIVSKNYFDRIGLEIAMNGFYIPVINMEGKLVFTPEDYDELRGKMIGLSYYGENNYIFSNNLINEDVSIIAEYIEQSNIETKRKRDLINSKIKESLSELGLVFKDKIDYDLSEGTVELIDTGSTGRGTNKPGDGDFDFMMRLDKRILLNSSKLNELKKNLLKKLGKEDSSELTGTGDFRLKKVKIDDETTVDIDITFTQKTDKISYSTDMCLQERLSNIYSQNPEYYNYVVANILLAKQILKQGEVYKPNRGENPQGGLGGVGIENWILQNGGSFMDAAKSFLDASNGKSFEEFKKDYYVWDFGENHMAESRGHYSHDNFVSNNMSQSGYDRMIKILNEFVRKYEHNQTDTIKR